MKTEEKQLRYLSEISDHKVDDGSSDVRGWEVRDSALRPIGTVKNLLVDTSTNRVVYLDVRVDDTIIDANHDPYGTSSNSKIREFVNEKGENHIIIPIGLVDLNNEKKYVFTDRIDHNTFANTKRIRENAPIDRSYEKAILTSYRRTAPDSDPVDSSRDSQGNQDLSRSDRRENSSERKNVGYEENSEVNAENVEWDDAEPKNSAHTNEMEDRSKFYGKKEFDDSKWRKL